MKWPTLPTILHIAKLGIHGTRVRIKILLLQILCCLNELYLLMQIASMLDGLRPSQTAIEDVFMRKFMTGTWHALIVSEVIIKRQHNMIRIAAIMRQAISPRKMYFLIGYTE
uniref:28S ribosomal protein S24, mitochondrial n=1 Tax=Bactrocera latifrons TaxID=174628 RepID=A0A0K8VUL8_BACLA